MTHPCEIACRTALNGLRAAAGPLAVERDKPVVPNVYFSWDAERAQIEVEVRPDAAGLARITAKAAGTPRWMSLWISLGVGSFAAQDGLGLAVEAGLDQAFQLTPRIRTRRGEATSDTHFAEPLALGPGSRTHGALRGLTAADPVVGEGLFHTLILPLPLGSFDVHLRDLRLFVLTGDRAAGLVMPTLGSFAS